MAVTYSSPTLVKNILKEIVKGEEEEERKKEEKQSVDVTPSQLLHS